MSVVLTTDSVDKAVTLFGDKKKIQTACEKAGASKEHAQAFHDDLVSRNGEIVKALMTVQAAIQKKMVGKDALQAVSGNAITKALFTGVVLKPQEAILGAGFEMSIHLKDDRLQLWVSFRKGGKQQLSNVPAPQAGAAPKKKNDDVVVAIKTKK